jgi:Flp pilus assembly protein TadD
MGRKRNEKRNRTTPTATAPTPARSSHVVLAAAMVALVAILPFANALSNGFVLDDVGIVVKSPQIRDLGNVGRMFSTDYWTGSGAEQSPVDAGLYRPLTVLTYAVNYAVSGLSAPAFHATNIVLHAAVAVVLFFVALEIFGVTAPAFATAAIFAVHPIHTEAVTSIVGRAEILAALFVLLAFWIGRSRAADDMTRGPGWLANEWSRAAATGGLYLLGLFSKETAATLPAIFLADDWLRRASLRRDGQSLVAMLAPRYLALALALAIYGAFRAHAVTHSAAVWKGFVDVSTGARVLTASRVLFEYLGLFVFPRTLLADYWLPDVPIAHTLAEPMVLLSLLVWSSFIALAFTRARGETTLWFGIAWFFITILPASNLLFPSGVGKAERILYLPSVGLCLVAGWGVMKLESRPRVAGLPLRAALVLVLVLLSARTFVRNRDWRDNPTLAEASLRVSPKSAIMNDLAAKPLVERGELRRAIPMLKVAVAQAPDNATFHLHLGLAHRADKQLDSAVAEYNAALRLDPNDPDALTDLGVIALDQHRLQDAEKLFLAALQSAPGHVEAHFDLGWTYFEGGRLDDAAAQFRAAIASDPSNADAHNNLGVVYLKGEQFDRATDEFMQALAIRPGYARARQNLALVRARKAGMVKR